MAEFPAGGAAPPYHEAVRALDAAGADVIAAAAAAADATANPTAGGWRDFLHLFNGTTWDRARSGADNADAVAVLALGLLRVASEPFAFNGSTWDRVRAAVALDAGLSAGVPTGHQALADDNNGTFVSVNAKGGFRYRVVSGVNAELQVVIDLRNLHDSLSIHMAASAGTATLTVEASADNVNWIQADSIAAAQFTVKVYGATTAGAAAAAAGAGPIAPLAYRYVRVTAGAAGASNTTTLTIGAK